MRQAQGKLRVHTPAQGLCEITEPVATWVAQQNMEFGLLTLFCRHTSASLLIQENADPDVLHDLEHFFRALVQENRSFFRHTAEGADDMPAHIRSALTPVQVSLPVERGRLSLGRWQGVFVFEHRRSPQTRDVILHLMGE